MSTVLEKLAKLNYNQAASALLADLIYAANAIRIPVNVRVGLPEAITHTPGKAIADTRITIQTLTGNLTRTTYAYNRIPLSYVKRDLNRKLPVTQEKFKISEVLEYLNIIWQTKLTMQDLTEAIHHVDEQTITIHSHPRSTNWVGSVDVTLVDQTKRFIKVSNFTLPEVGSLLSDVDAVYQGLSQANGKPINADNASLSEPSLALAGNFNTQVVLTPTDPQHEPITCHYDRKRLGEALGHASSLAPIYVDVLPMTTHELLYRINVALGLNLKPSEVQNTTLERWAETLTLTIPTDQSSYYWLKSSVNVPLTFNPNLRFTTDGVLRRTSDGTPRKI